MYFEAECRKGAFAGYQLDKTAKAGYSGAGYLESAATSLDANTSTDEATYFFETGAGAYNFFFRINNNANAYQRLVVLSRRQRQLDRDGQYE